MNGFYLTVGALIAIALSMWARRCWVSYRDTRDLLVSDRDRFELILPYEPSARERRL